MNGQVDGPLHAGGALAQDFRPAIAARRRPRGHHHVGDAVELDRRLRHLAKLLRRFAFDGAAGRQGLADGAELASLGPALIADAGLQDRRRQHVAAVQGRDLRVGDAVRRRELVEARAQAKFHFADLGAVAVHTATPEPIRLIDHIGALEGRRVVHRDHHRRAVDGHGHVVGRAGSAAPALAGLGIDETNSEGLQLVDQLLGRHPCLLRLLVLRGRFHRAVL